MQRSHLLAPTLTLTALLLFSATSRAQMIVHTGDNLVALAAAAADGAVLEIHSDSTFLGTLSWSGKALTIQAGAGFTPSIKGSPGETVAVLPGSNPPSKATFRDLTLERGDTVFDPSLGIDITPSAFGIYGYGFGGLSNFVELTLDGCTVIGELTGVGNGNPDFTGNFLSTQFQDGVQFSGIGDMPTSLTFNDCKIAGPVISWTVGNVQTNLDFHRTEILFSIYCKASQTSATNLTLESSLIKKVGYDSIGATLIGNISSTFTNVTVTGFLTGIKGGSAGPNVMENMLLFGNTSDIVSISVNEISNSLIADGTYDGLNGNFAGSVALDANNNLLGCSAGLDQGNNAAPHLGATDLNGAPRIQDNDGDGTATVNVGATEATGATLGSVLTANGTGINALDLAALNLPAAGTNFDTQISTPPGTVLTAVAYDTAAPIPFALPGLVGEFLISLTATLYIDYASGLHSQPIPADCALVGATTRVQGFRAEASGPGIVVYCLNGLDLVIGG